jgi:uncharacterized membrane protein YbaN (DUF454 family)
MPTLIGLIFLLASAYCFFQKDDRLFALVIVSAIFQASSVISSDAHGVQPYYAVAAIFVLQSMLRGRNVGKPSFRGRGWMILFAVIGIASAFILPVVFAGTPVYDPYVGIDDGLFIRPPLQLGLANLTQSVYLLLDVLVVVGASRNVNGVNFTLRAYKLAFYLVAGTVILQFLFSVFGVEFPYYLLQTHGGYSLQGVQTGEWSSRYPGTFTESSGAGLVLASFTAGFLAERMKFGRSLLPCLTGLFAIFLVRSTSSMAAVGLTFLGLLIAHPVFRFPYHLNAIYLKRSILLIVAGAAALALVAFSPLRDSLISATLEKGESSSFVNRLASDQYAMELFSVTKGIGVGMGSNRPSSLITSLLSTVGLAGFAVFLLAYSGLLANSTRENSWLRWVGCALFLDMALGGPDYTMPWVWVILAFAVQMGRLSDDKLLAHERKAA